MVAPRYQGQLGRAALQMPNVAQVLGRSGGNLAGAVLRANLPCRLVELDAGIAARSTVDRTEWFGRRELYWVDDYEIPGNARITVDGVPGVWSVVTNTIVPHPAGAAVPLFWSCDLVAAR